MANERLQTTRRAFLATGALGAVAGLGTQGLAAGAGERALDPTATIDCSVVRVDDWDGATSARAVFRDGTFVSIGSGTPEAFGAPGRVVETVTFDDADGRSATVSNDATDCDPGEAAVTFTDARATVRGGQFGDLGKRPGTLLSSVDLHFVDGTTENVVHFEGPPEPIPTVYRGSGEHEGKVIEAVNVFYDLNYTTHYIRNPAADKHLLGAETCQERCLEVMGASPGAVDYELTVDGPVRPVSITERRSAEPDGNDAITENSDGTWTVTGRTGNPGYGDVFAVNGEVQSFTQTGGPGDYVLRECEWRIVDDTAPSTDILSVVGTEAGDVEYEFTVDGRVRPVTNACKWLSAETDGNDTVTENDDGTVTVSGFTGNAGYGDTYAVSGDVTDFRRTGGDADFRIEYNGHELTPEELVDER